MKILHIITDLKDGGAEAVLYRLVKCDTQNSHKVICLGDGGKYVSLFEELGIEVELVNLKSIPSGLIRLLKLGSTIKQFEPDVVQGWMYHGNFIAGLYGWIYSNIKIYWGIHHTNLIKGVDPWSTHFVSWCCAKLSKIPKRIICCGDRSRDIHKQYGYMSDRLVVIPNGYDTSKFSFNEISRSVTRDKLGLPRDAFVLATVGRFAPQKDHKNLLNALSIAKHKFSIPFKHLLIGSGLTPENNEIRNMLVELGLSKDVMLLGQISNIEEVMCTLDVHVTSSAFGEAFPNVICESMLCETVCVSTDVGDAKLIISDAGYIVPPSNPEKLGLAISQAYALFHNENERWITVKKEARKRINDNFSIEKMTESYVSIWKD